MRILIADDEIVLLDLIKDALQGEFKVDAVHTKEDIRLHLDAYSYQVLVLDRNFYGHDIMQETINYAKAKNPTMGILVISAMSSVDDKVGGLLSGADDYLEKPFDNKELKARIYALSRRFSGNLYSFETTQINLDTKQVVQDNEVVNLTKNEAALLFLLLARRGCILSKNEIIDNLYIHPENILSNSIDELVFRLRKKINPKIIRTVKTRGFIID